MQRFLSSLSNWMTLEPAERNNLLQAIGRLSAVRASLAWSVGVDRNNNGVIERDALGFNYEPSDIEFLKGVRPPQGFTKIEMSSDVDVRAWRGNWEGFTCNLMVELTYAVGGHSYYLTADCNHLKGS